MRSQGRASPCTPSHTGGPSDAFDDSEPATGGQGDLAIQFVPQALTSYGGLELLGRYLHRIDLGASLLTLAHEFPTVWADPATDARTKKRLVRLLIEEIIVSPLDTRVLELLIHWKGGQHTRLHVPRNRTGQHRRCTDRAVVDVVRDLARRVPDAQIARLLNRLGYRTGAGNTWTQQRVVSLRHAHDIPVYTPGVDGAALTIGQAADQLGVSPTTVRKLIVSGQLPATQPVPYAPWAIQPDDLTTAGVQRVVRAVKAGRRLPQTSSDTQLPLINPRT
jgi:hypothetical protein